MVGLHELEKISPIYVDLNSGWRLAQAVQCLPNNHEVLSSNHSTAKINKEKYI
jgi:hypothetical protein